MRGCGSVQKKIGGEIDRNTQVDCHRGGVVVGEALFIIHANTETQVIQVSRKKNHYCPRAGAADEAKVFVTSSTLRSSYTACTTCLFRFVAIPLKPT